jgi:hypothetical protein
MLRNLKTSDIFKMSKILKIMDIKIDVENKTQQQLGAEVILNIFENIHLAEDEVSEFIAEIAGITVEQFKDLDIDKTLEIFNEFKQMPGIVNFFRSASR